MPRLATKTSKLYFFVLKPYQYHSMQFDLKLLCRLMDPAELLLIRMWTCAVSLKTVPLRQIISTFDCSTTAPCAESHLALLHVQSSPFILLNYTFPFYNICDTVRRHMTLTYCITLPLASTTSFILQMISASNCVNVGCLLDPDNINPTTVQASGNNIIGPVPSYLSCWCLSRIL